MRIGRVGGAMFAGGCVLMVLAAGIAATGRPVGLGLRDAEGQPVIDLGVVVVTAATILGGIGAAVLSGSAPRPLHRAGTRVGLGILAVGLLSLSVLAAPFLAFALDPETGASMTLLLVGLLATVAGPMVTSLSLVRTPGPTRVVGGLFLVGLVLLVLREFLRPYVGQVDPLALLAMLGWTLAIVSGIGVGVLPFAGERTGMTNLASR